MRTKNRRVIKLKSLARKEKGPRKRAFIVSFRLLLAKEDKVFIEKIFIH
ncbi:hypothetical protein KKC1_09820 [Calderihabitans maritimus]|uniref:Uncharacterized protein n=1 Tax=Calderihabitans maritimus TaxID=1246530 RepID=A0A1Z5HQL3_9FIRM|nr:hypothetical protein KKC1_09820 [Calderihabitans maritimus]